MKNIGQSIRFINTCDGQKKKKKELLIAHCADIRLVINEDKSHGSRLPVRAGVSWFSPIPSGILDCQKSIDFGDVDPPSPLG